MKVGAGLLDVLDVAKRQNTRVTYAEAVKLRRKLIKIQRHFDLDAITHIHVINAAGVARLDIRNNRLRACDLGRGRAGDFHLCVLQLVRST